MRDCRGAALVEFAIIFPVTLLVIIGGIDVGMAMLNKMQLEFATESAARCFAIKNVNCPTTAAAADYAAGLVPTVLGITPANFTASTLPCGGAVTATYTYAPMFLPAPIPLGATACYPS